MFIEYIEAIQKIRGKRLKDIRPGLGTELVLEFEDGTLIDINTNHFPDGTINEIIIDIKE